MYITQAPPPAHPRRKKTSAPPPGPPTHVAKNERLRITNPASKSPVWSLTSTYILIHRTLEGQRRCFFCDVGGWRRGRGARFFATWVGGWRRLRDIHTRYKPRQRALRPLAATQANRALPGKIRQKIGCTHWSRSRWWWWRQGRSWSRSFCYCCLHGRGVRHCTPPLKVPKSRRPKISTTVRRAPQQELAQ
jgi:hypothetical protein